MASPYPKASLRVRAPSLGTAKWMGKIQAASNTLVTLTFIVKPQFAPSATFTLKKEVRKTDFWMVPRLQVNAGDKMNYLISYDNTSDVLQDNVVIKDTRCLPGPPRQRYNLCQLHQPWRVKSYKIATGNGMKYWKLRWTFCCVCKILPTRSHQITRCHFVAPTALKNVARATTDMGGKKMVRMSLSLKPVPTHQPPAARLSSSREDFTDRV